MLKGERPENILVINVGSSSLKYSFYDTADESRGTKGLAMQRDNLLMFYAPFSGKK
jgi:acetate kinase